MLKLIYVIRFLVPLAFVGAASSVSYNCGNDNYVCSLVNVHIERDKAEFDVTSIYPGSAFGRLLIEDSLVPVLTVKQACKTLKQLTQIWVTAVGVEEIKKEAFSTCPELRRLRITGNKLKQLPANLFEYNKALFYVFFSDNSITSLPENLFKYNPNLQYIDGGNNSLTELPKDLFKNNQRLIGIDLKKNKLREVPFSAFRSKCDSVEALNLADNDLTAINPETLIQTFPNLKYIGFDGNYLHCEKYFELMEFLQNEKQIEVIQQSEKICENGTRW